jgi:uncharacterized protein (UPF0147 family)
MDELTYRECMPFWVSASNCIGTTFLAASLLRVSGLSAKAHLRVAEIPSTRTSDGRAYTLLRCCLLMSAWCVCVHAQGAGPPTVAMSASDDGDAAMAIVVARERSCSDRQSALNSWWMSFEPNFKISASDFTALAKIVRDENEPFELRSDIVHTMAACGYVQTENDCPGLLLQLMDDSCVDRRIRVLAAVALTNLPHSIADIDDIVTVILNCSHSDKERSEALSACCSLVFIRPSEMGELHRRMLLIAISDREGEHIRLEALRSFLYSVEWLARSENQRDLLSTQDILMKILQDRTTSISIRRTAIDLAGILFPLATDNTEQRFELCHSLAEYLVSVLTAPSESVEIQESAKNAIGSLLPFIDLTMVERLAEPLKSDSPKLFQRSLIATLESLKCLAVPAIPTLRTLSTQSSDAELRTAAKKAIETITSECEKSD